MTEKAVNPKTMLKAALRKTALDARKKAFIENGEKAAHALTDLLFKHYHFKKNSVIAGYIPMNCEINAMIPMKRLEDEGHQLLLPTIDSSDLPLEFMTWDFSVPLEPSRWDTKAPIIGDMMDPQIILAPLVAFDRTGHRLGYGGGFYDRTLAQLRKKRSVYAIGLAFSAQECAIIPAEATDQKLDAVVTEDYFKVF